VPGTSEECGAASTTAAGVDLTSEGSSLVNTSVEAYLRTCSGSWMSTKAVDHLDHGMLGVEEMERVRTNRHLRMEICVQAWPPSGIFVQGVRPPSRWPLRPPHQALVLRKQRGKPAGMPEDHGSVAELVALASFTTASSALAVYTGSVRMPSLLATRDIAARPPGVGIA